MPIGQRARSAGLLSIITRPSVRQAHEGCPLVQAIPEIFRRYERPNPALLHPFAQALGAARAIQNPNRGVIVMQMIAG